MKRGEVLSVTPGQSWSLILLAPDTTDWLVGLLSALIPHTQVHMDSKQEALAAAARQLLMAFCSLTGEVLPKRPKQKHLSGKSIDQTCHEMHGKGVVTSEQTVNDSKLGWNGKNSYLGGTSPNFALVLFTLHRSDTKVW